MELFVILSPIIATVLLVAMLYVGKKVKFNNWYSELQYTAANNRKKTPSKEEAYKYYKEKRTPKQALDGHNVDIF